MTGLEINRPTGPEPSPARAAGLRPHLPPTLLSPNRGRSRPILLAVLLAATPRRRAPRRHFPPPRPHGTQSVAADDASESSPRVPALEPPYSRRGGGGPAILGFAGRNRHRQP